MPIGPVMFDLTGLTLSPEERDILQNPLLGGVILFSRNFQSPEQLQTLIFQIRDTRGNTPLIIAVDQEGGRVQRFQKGFTLLPPLSRFGELFDQDPEQALKVTETAGWLMAIELLSVGIDISFAPVLDLKSSVSEIIGNRAFHSDPAIVSLLARAYIKGMNKAGMQATGKHFPGHGSVMADSHLELPFDERSFANVAGSDLIPFAQLAKNDLTGIMTAHIVFSQVDEKPVSFSSHWLSHTLRKQLGFKGVILSDDLSMAGAACIGDFVQRGHAAIEAGCDMILVCNNRQAVYDVLKSLEGYDNRQSAQRLLKLCGRFQYTYTELKKNALWQQALDTVKNLYGQQTTT